MRRILEGQPFMPGLLESTSTEKRLEADCYLTEGAGIFTLDSKLVGTTDSSIFFAKSQTEQRLDSKTAVVFLSVGENTLIDVNGKRVPFGESRSFRTLRGNVRYIKNN